ATGVIVTVVAATALSVTTLAGIAPFVTLNAFLSLIDGAEKKPAATRKSIAPTMHPLRKARPLFCANKRLPARSESSAGGGFGAGGGSGFQLRAERCLPTISDAGRATTKRSVPNIHHPTKERHLRCAIAPGMHPRMDASTR